MTRAATASTHASSGMAGAGAGSGVSSHRSAKRRQPHLQRLERDREQERRQDGHEVRALAGHHHEEGIYRPGVGWVGQPEESKDRVVSRKNVSRESFTEYVKNIYRVLLTRGLRGCYVHFLDPQTRDFVLSRLERPALRKVAELRSAY